MPDAWLKVLMKVNSSFNPFIASRTFATMSGFLIFFGFIVFPFFKFFPGVREPPRGLPEEAHKCYAIADKLTVIFA
jgi:quinol-cytochrome oxidoreductase complex cytochrome b subunit